NGLYEDTVIVAYADHYLYTLNDKSILDKYKNTSNNLINHTPFFIWSSDTDAENIDKATMQTNILPTVLNLFGIEYNPNVYIGKDALAEDYDGCIFFSDYSWYDGNIYVENGHITNGGEADQEYIEYISEKIGTVVRKNDLTLRYNYFKKKNKK
ncbi:MAG: sulfatase-like hydrolase/transferase, partial [Lachnospiraceae bacterium]|nr:sulfatase-like hydrolase/transferase [Lachnospiraceae bacterium]